jgi:hypothetical protein
MKECRACVPSRGTELRAAEPSRGTPRLLIHSRPHSSAPEISTIYSRRTWLEGMDDFRDQNKPMDRCDEDKLHGYVGVRESAVTIYNLIFGSLYQWQQQWMSQVLSLFP